MRLAGGNVLLSMLCTRCGGALAAVGVAVFTTPPLSAQVTPSSLVGVVVDSAGAAIAGAVIRVVRPATDAAEEFALASAGITDRTGRFSVIGLSPGAIRFSVVHPQYASSVTEAELAAGVTVSLRITLRAIEADIPRLEPAPELLRGVVRDSSGAPVPSAEVSVVGTDVTVRTDSLGQFVLPGLRGAPVWLRARRLGYSAAFVRPADDGARTEIVLRPLGQQLGRVTVLSARESRRMADMEQRKALYGGVHIRREEIERRNPIRISDLLQGRNAALGIRRGAGSEGIPVGRLGCPMAILLNGTYFPGGVGVDQLMVPREVAAVEAYPSEITVPSELMALVPGDAWKCGVLVVWTR